MRIFVAGKLMIFIALFMRLRIINTQGLSRGFPNVFFAPKKSRILMIKYTFLILLVITTISACIGGDETDNDEQPGFLKSPKLMEGEVLVYISNGSKQCESKGMSPEVSAQILIDKNIDVVSSHCGFITGMAVIALCGAGTLEINLHVINLADISVAEKEGFDPVSKLGEQEGVGYQVLECEKAHIGDMN
jgi:hypothetical protein